jgi:hypothetical protein
MVLFSAVRGHKEYHGHQRNIVVYFYLDRSDLQYFRGGVSQERKIGQMKNIMRITVVDEHTDDHTSSLVPWWLVLCLSFGSILFPSISE